MNTIYIHGLYSYPKESKLSILKSFDLKPFAEHIVYEQTPDSYNLLKTLISKHKIEFIVGSSLGGYLGYWLSEDLGLPCLLFNPAIIYSNKPELIIPEIKIGNCPIRLVVQGKKDTIVDLKQNKIFLQENTLADQKQKIICLDWLEHSIDLVTFEISVHWALESIAKFNEKK